MELNEGMSAPNFELRSDDGKVYSLSQYKGKKEVVLYFYPKDDTPGCTKEACAFRDSISQFNKKNVQILGVSTDGLNSHSKFRTKYNLNFPLLSDEDHKVSELYDAYQMKNLYGNKFMGISRSTFVIDKSGTIKKIFKRVQVDGHSDELLKIV